MTKQVEEIRRLNAHVQSAAQQLIQPERNQLACHREFGGYSQMFPARLIRALGVFVVLSNKILIHRLM